MGVSNQWNGIWTGIVEWNGGIVKINSKTASNGKLLFKPRYTRHGLLMLLLQVMATIIKYDICIMKQQIKIYVLNFMCKWYISFSILFQ